MNEQIKIDYEDEVIQGQLSNEKKERSFVDIRSLDVPGSHCQITFKSWPRSGYALTSSRSLIHFNPKTINTW